MIHYITFLFVLFSALNSNAAVLVRGNNPSAPFGFNSTINSIVFDPLSGTFCVGLQQNDESAIDQFSVSCASRPSFSGSFRFNGIATDDLLFDRGINQLALSSAPNIDPVTLATRTNDPSSIVGVSGQVRTIFSSAGIPHTVNITSASDILDDALGLPTSEIITLEASPSFVFAAVPQSKQPFGAPNTASGIALVSINRTATGFSLSPLNAQTGTSGNRAVPLGNASTQITGGTNNVTFLTGSDRNQVAFYFDPVLNLLYTGLRIQTGTMPGDIAKAVVVGNVNNQNQLTLRSIVPNTALDTNNRIVAALINAMIPVTLSIKEIAVLHTSTGPDYLIVNGGKGTTAEVGNQVYALPLVNDPSNSSIHGTLADKTSSLDPERHVFVVPATTPAGLVLASDPAALVGAGDIPIQADNSITSLQAVGDTVFVSSANPNDMLNNSGIFFSRAQFDVTGKIARWTPWQRITSQLLFPGIDPSNDINAGLISDFAVDARTGLIWFVEGATNRNVGLASWTTNNTGSAVNTPGLIAALNNAFPNGIFSVLDLNQSTMGFTDITTAGFRYALFGGSNKVAFAVISKSNNVTDINAPQTLITDFTLPENFLVTQLPANAGCVTVLEYARQTSGEGEQNYFFAGTDMGLFVFAGPNGEGFSVDDLMKLDEPPFSTGFWQRAPNINGSITQIRTSGNRLYILAQTGTPENPLQSTIYSVPFDIDIETMFADPDIIAQTGTAPFDNVLQFFDLALLATGPMADPAMHEQLVVATNQGLFFSSNPNGVQTATNQTTANFQLLEGTEELLFNGISQTTDQPQFTVWPFAMVDDLAGRGTFTRSVLFQLNAGSDATSPFIALNPLPFNAQNSTLFPTFDHISGFFTDGARRFLVTQPLNTANPGMRLNILPFNTADWNANALLTLIYGPLANFNQFYWVQNIGASGLMLVGTNNGVVGLA